MAEGQTDGARARHGGQLDWALASFIILVRCVNAALVQTSFVPDEYWQSLEVAHRMLFGYGELTWEWDLGIRSTLHPLLYAVFAYPLHVLGLGDRALLVAAAAVQTALAICADVCLFYGVARLFGPRAARFAVYCQLASWFQFYTCTRTLANSIEASLLPVALVAWPGLEGRTAPLRLELASLAAAVVSVLIRPPAAIFYGTLFLLTFARSRAHVARACLVALPIVLLGAVTDRLFYGHWMLPALSFLRINVAEGVASAYGTHAWHWYASAGLPAVLATSAPLVLLALRDPATRTLSVVVAAVVYLAVLSACPHKELRFLQALLPVAHALCGRALAAFPHIVCGRRVSATAILISLVATQVPLGLYAGLVHQRGTIDVMGYLARDVAAAPDLATQRVLFLLPCHATPMYSHLRTNVSVEYLRCETARPGAPGADQEAFFADPAAWLQDRFVLPLPALMPSHVVMFEPLTPAVRPWAELHKYRPCKRYFHTHVPDGRVGAYIFVYKRDRC